ncbi:hypothetical protein ENSA5_42060 [Enhygromyxa salina]|uniref:Lipoprotein n=1 Tax=Enhygromyxa salina TaxID=215803 RepID=A0A2S9XLP0_9BACT|nr:hypothetical protein [Enhygromyxa salina]PRP93804.1 hypothetical protein ENSA5_42060 [Enhygromyxa salina]
MTMTHSKILTLVGIASLSAAVGCKPKVASNQDMLAEYGGEKYSEDMVATDYETVEDQGDSIDPRTQAAIQDTISTVYVTDFEACLEKEMDRLENRWVAGTFAIEFTIEPSGMVSGAEMLQEDIEERRTLNDKGEYVSSGGATPRKAENFGACVEEKVYRWEFDPPPEVTYSHTYNGQIGEAW